MWKSGTSGNPGGTIREKKFLAALERAVAQDSGVKLRQAADKLLDCAALGEPWAIQQLADRLDGKPTQQVDMNVTREVRYLTEQEILERLASLGSGVASGVTQDKKSEGKSKKLH